MRSELEPMLFDVVTMEDRIVVAQKYLLEHLHLEHGNPIVMEAVAEMICRKGNVEIGKLSKEVHTSSRQLERLFRENIGVSPKQLSSLIRYQYLWNDILFHPNFQVLDAVFRYGYTDQAHLLHDFKRFHTMTIADARKYAFEHAAFIQE